VLRRHVRSAALNDFAGIDHRPARPTSTALGTCLNITEHQSRWRRRESKTFVTPDTSGACTDSPALTATFVTSGRFEFGMVGSVWAARWQPTWSAPTGLQPSDRRRSPACRASGRAASSLCGGARAKLKASEIRRCQPEWVTRLRPMTSVLLASGMTGLQTPRWHADQWPESRARVIEGSLRRGHEPQRRAGEARVSAR